jgi:ubiquinone/menaquinone biosynthesis C-methylase UbiE
VSKLVEQYSGQGATGYDDQRVGTKRFKAEEEAFDKLFALASPKTVLDIPVGTGRWFPAYVHAQVAVLGIDASKDMLQEAGKKLQKLGARGIELTKGDAFDRAFFESLGRRFDLVVCVRFLNWIPSERVATVLANLDAVAENHVLIGVGVLQGSKGSLKRLRAKLTLWSTNIRRKRQGRAQEHVHDPTLIATLTDNLGWKEVERSYIFSRNGRDSYFVLYRRKG